MAPNPRPSATTVLSIAILLAIASSADATPKLVKWVAGGGGNGLVRVGRQLTPMGGTSGQPTSGTFVAGPYTLVSGFWVPNGIINVSVGDSLPPVPGRPPSVSYIRPLAPNPFVRSARLELALAADGPATVRLYDIQGALVRTLQDGWLPAGRYSLSLDSDSRGGGPLGPGLYLLSTQIPGLSRTQKIVLLR